MQSCNPATLNPATRPPPTRLQNPAPGATGNLDLYSADYPAKVLNQRVSFYRILFSNKPASKAAMLTSLVAHRCGGRWERDSQHTLEGQGAVQEAGGFGLVGKQELGTRCEGCVRAGQAGRYRCRLRDGLAV